MAFDKAKNGRNKPELVIGKRFGMIVVLAISRAANNRALAEVRCDCGATKRIRYDVIMRGDAISCGCYGKTKCITHGDSTTRTTKEYQTWKGIKSRVSNSRSNSYRHYGGRGIKMCERWVSSFTNFLADVGRAPSPKHSIDRINNDGDYEASNCRWATPKQQARNRRQTKMSEFLATKIRELRCEGMMPKNIREYLDLTEGQVNNVLYNNQWIGV